MKQFVGIKTVRKDQIDYPSSGNPRLEGLDKSDPKIIGLAKSIETEGLLYPPILCETGDGRYDPIDGDRRLIAWFDSLGNNEVNASIYRVDNLNELRMMRLSANWDREDFSAIEKGAYMWSILEDKMASDGRSPIDEFWNQRGIRNEYLSWLASVLAKPKSTVARYITTWLNVPEKFRDRIARSRNELKAGKISPSKAAVVDRIARKVKQTEATWDYFVPKKKPVTVKTKTLEKTERAIKRGQVKTFQQVKEYVEDKAPELTEARFELTVEEEKRAAVLASEMDTEISKVYRGGIYLAEKHLEELAGVVKEI